MLLCRPMLLTVAGKVDGIAADVTCATDVTCC